MSNHVPCLNHLLYLGESARLLRHVQRTYDADLRPETGVEAFLVNDMAVNHWRVWRLQTMEASLVNHQISQQGEPENRLPAGAAVLACQTIHAFSGIIPLLSRLETAARRAYREALRLLHVCQDRRTRPAPPPDLNQTESPKE
jgi:hypothetical protein